MTKRNQIVFTRICAVNRDVVYIGTMPEDQELATPFTAICQYDHGEWSYEAFDFSLASLTLFKAPTGADRVLYVLSENGIAVNFHTKVRETLLSAASPLRKKHQLGRLRKIQQVGDHLFACGDGGQTYRRDRDGNWKVLSEDFLDGPAAIADRNSELSLAMMELVKGGGKDAALIEKVRRLGLQSDPIILWGLSGTSDVNVYFASEKKVVYHYDGARITSVPTDADEGLIAVHAIDAETVYACGRRGNLLVGNSKSGFRKMNFHDSQVFNGMAMFQGKLYLSSTGRPRGLFVYDGSKLERVNSGLMPDIDDVSAVSAVGDEVLWVMGEKDLLRFDGETWERIAFPPNALDQ